MLVLRASRVVEFDPEAGFAGLVSDGTRRWGHGVGVRTSAISTRFFADRTEQFLLQRPEDAGSGRDAGTWQL